MAEKSPSLTVPKWQEMSSGLSFKWDSFNGYSLVRRVFADCTGEKSCQEWKANNLRKFFLSRLVSMSRAVLPLIKEELVNGIAHITGGGFIENVPRMFAADGC